MSKFTPKTRSVIGRVPPIPGVRSRSSSGVSTNGAAGGRRSRLVAFVGMLALLAVVGALLPRAASAAPVPFACATPTAFDANGTPTTLDQQIQGAGDSSFTPLGTNTQWTYNAVAFDPTNGFMYALSQGNSPNGQLAGQLLQIDSTGAITNLGQVTGAISSDLTNGMNAGFFSNGTYYVSNGLGTGTIYSLNLTTRVLTPITGTAGTAVNDWAALDGFAWGVQNANGTAGRATIVRVNLTTGAISRFQAPVQMQIAASITSLAGQYGAAWTYANGNLAFDSNAGGLYQVSVANPTSANPTFALVSQTVGPASSNNDGTYCGNPANLTITKSASSVASADGSEVAAGGTVTWTLKVSNTSAGNTSGFVVNDPVPAGWAVQTVSSDAGSGAASGCTVGPQAAPSSNTAANNVQCIEGVLDAGSTFTITITAKAPTTGCVTNIGNVLGNEQTDGTQASNGVTTCVDSFTYSKTASVSNLPGDPLSPPAFPGATVTYTVNVTNTGSGAYTATDPASITDDLTNVLQDATFGSVTGTPAGWTVARTGNTLSGSGPLAVGATATITYTAIVDNPENGTPLVNAVTSTNPTGSCAPLLVCTTTTPVELSPSISIVKSATPTTVTAAGQTVDYSFLVTNTGNVTLNPVVVNDTSFSGTGTMSTISCPDASLAAGAAETCTATYKVTQADIDAGSVVNTATATGTPPNGGTPVTSPPSTATVTATPAPALTIVKSATPTTVTAAGQTVDYSFLVTNTGNVTLSPVVVNDTSFSGTGTLSAISCPGTSLAPGTNETCTATYKVTQADINAGKITNTATATGTPPNGGTPVTSPPSSTTVTATPGPSLTIVKSASPTTVTAASQTVDYSFLVTNTGNVTLNPVVVNDTNFSGTGTLSAISCPDTSLAPSADETCTATYKVTQADIDAGSVTNTATATGTPPNGGTPVTSPPSTATVTATPTPGLTIVKSATPTTVGTVGQTVTYSFLVTNTGNVTLSPVVVNETSFSGTGTLSAISCPDTSLAPGTNETCTATYKVTQADLTAGKITNTAIATGTPPNGGTPVTSPPSTVTIPASDLTVTKSVSPTSGTTVNEGQTLTYTLTFDNSRGDTTTPTFSYTDDLADVLDDATLTSGPTVSPAGNGVTASAVSGSSFTVAGTLAAGADVTVTYTVKVDDPDTGGNQVLNNYVFTDWVDTADLVCVDEPRLHDQSDRGIAVAHDREDRNPDRRSTRPAKRLITASW